MPQTLYLIDAYAQIFRAYYAIRGGMRSPVTSEPTHAVFGFTGMLLKLLSQYRPEYVVVAADSPGPTFRDDLYTEYKGTRSAMPDDLAAQIPRVFEVIEAFGIPVVRQPGLEADDVIATIAARILADPSFADVEIRMVSKDKDLEQLLCERVHMFDVHTDVLLDVEGLFANKGIRPEQVIDYLTLTGDTVDNVPGVEGIGPKTASQLIQQFGSLDGIYANLDQLKGKRRENLEAARDRIGLSRQLVTLKLDGDFPFRVEEALVRPLSMSRLVPLFQQLGFNRYQVDARALSGDAEGPSSEVDSTAPSAPAEATPPQSANPDAYEVVRTLEELHALAEDLRAQEVISVDSETTGLDAEAELCGLCLAWKPGHGVYVPVRSPEPETHLSEEAVLSVLRPILEDPAIAKCGHNLKFDARQLLRCGVRLRGVRFDTMLASTLLDPANQAHKLDALALQHLNYRMIPISSLLGEGAEQVSMATVPLEKVVPYAAEDADITLRLYHLLAPLVEAHGMTRLLREVESPLCVVLAEMETNGILCDPEELLRQGEHLGVRVEELRVQVLEVSGCDFHLDSPRQLEEVLFDKLGFTSSKRTKTARSTDITVLEKLAAQEDRNDPRTSVPRLVIEYRQLQKLISTYLGNLRGSVNGRTGRIHTSFHQLVTATGRLASHGPNLQNIPVRTDVGRQIRKAFHAEAGHRLICADYSQIELRILAHLSGDEALLEAFRHDLDIHTAVASQVFGVSPEDVSRDQRSHAKTINFGIIYGVTPFGLARRIEGLDIEGATRLINDYKARFPGIDQFLQKCIQHGLEQGYVTTMLGRRRAIPELASPNRHTQSLGERLAINSVVQGSAADLIKIAMVNVQDRIDRDRLPLRLLLQIHDELVLETPEELANTHAEIVRDEMERALTLQIPLRAEAGIGVDWMSAK